MTTFILTWNPFTRWVWPDKHYLRMIRLTEVGNRPKGQWSVGNRREGIVPGDRAFLFRQHDQRGIVASGYFTSKIFSEAHWDGSNRKAFYAKLDWDTVVEADARLPIESLKTRAPGVAWDRLQGSGVQVADQAVGRLESLWAKHLGRSPLALSGEIPSSHTYREGSMIKVMVNRYERDRRATAKCKEHWGTTCHVCDLDFAERYGQIGNDFIHVHHLREIATIGKEYEVDPINDLRPVCPNCHAMLHRHSPPLSINALKKRLRD